MQQMTTAIQQLGLYHATCQNYKSGCWVMQTVSGVTEEQLSSVEEFLLQARQSIRTFKL